MGAHCLPARIPCAEIAPAPSLLPYHYFTREYIIQVGEMGWWWTGREGINKASKKEARVVWRSCLRAREIAAGGGGAVQHVISSLALQSSQTTYLRKLRWSSSTALI